jgi:Na+-transporting NADH:ubiquinone oxidoreductase subunit C
MANDSVGRTLLVAFLVCFVCSLLVSAAAMGLRTVKERDARLITYRQVLAVAGLLDDDPEAVWNARVEMKLVELADGRYREDLDPWSFNPRRAAADPKRNYRIPAELDLAEIKTRARQAPVYLIRDGEELSQVILPVHGKGLWSTLYGYLALAPDLTTVKGFGFYEHGETPGLGGEVDNPEWRAQWPGKQVRDAQGSPVIEVLRGKVEATDPLARHRIDGLSGATITSRGVTNLLRYWLGEDGFGPYLRRLAEQGGSHG